MQKLLAALLLLLFFTAQAQVDPHKLDSLKRSIDANAKALQSWQDSFTKKQDSLYKIQLEIAQERNRKSATEAEVAEEKDDRKKQWILVSIGIAMLAVILLLLRRKKND